MKGYALLVNRFDREYAKCMKYHPIGGMMFTFFGFPLLTLSFMGIFMYAVACVFEFISHLFTMIF